MSSALPHAQSWIPFTWASHSTASKALLLFGAAMALAFVAALVWSQFDLRTLRGVGIWAKPMKFLVATALFAWTTVWLATLASSTVVHGGAFKGIAVLIIVTALFEVGYITYRAWQGVGSHYNTTDTWSSALFGLMALAAVGLTTSQAWLAIEIWREPRITPMTVVGLGVVAGLLLTFVLSTVSGFMLGGQQPPPGPGMPLTGWHSAQDARPAHFLGVHAQQFIPLLALLAERTLGGHASWGFAAGVLAYVLAWIVLM